MSRHAVVLAGGLATRMQPRTLTLPKLLIEVNGEPFADLQLGLLRRCGYDRVTYCIAHLGEQIRAHLGDGARFGVAIDYSEEGPSLLGTGGALRAALPNLDETFLVTYGDSYLPFDYAEPLETLRDHRDDCDGVMAVFDNQRAWDASNVRTDGAWVLAYEKGTTDPAFDHIDYGAMALTKAAVGALPEGKVGLDVLQADLARRRRLRACIARERFYEIGSPQGLEALEQRLKEPR